MLNRHVDLSHRVKRRKQPDNFLDGPLPFICVDLCIVCDDNRLPFLSIATFWRGRSGARGDFDQLLIIEKNCQFTCCSHPLRFPFSCDSILQLAALFLLSFISPSCDACLIAARPLKVLEFIVHVDVISRPLNALALNKMPN
jgi:hypothetical protein